MRLWQFALLMYQPQPWLRLAFLLGLGWPRVLLQEQSAQFLLLLRQCRR
jgi:hypothetical protein